MDVTKLYRPMTPGEHATAVSDLIDERNMLLRHLKDAAATLRLADRSHAWAAEKDRCVIRLEAVIIKAEKK